MKSKHLDLEVNIDPKNSFISVKGRLTLKMIDKELKLFLNQNLEWKSLAIFIDGEKKEVKAKKIDIPKDSFLKSVNYWKIELPPQLIQQASLELEFGHYGKIFQEEVSYGIGYIKEEEVELACYSAWYPITTIQDHLSFSVTLFGPPNWSWIMNAPSIPCEKANCWKSNEERIDLTLLGRHLSTAIPPTQKRRFWGAKRYFSKFEPLEQDLKDLESQLHQWLGASPVKEVRLVLVTREQGGAYNRAGLIVLPDKLPDKYFTTKKPDLFFGLIHEIGHSWFIKTDPESYHNWLDEALCDFCALIVLGEKYGKEFVSDRLNQIHEQLKKAGELPPIKNITRTHPKAEIVFYKYGSLILYDLSQKIGLEIFKKAVRDFAQKSVNQEKIITKDFIHSIRNTTGQDMKDYFDKKLENIPSI
ncbi:MAG: M1 family aminopeptidase [Promethearchaeota archaeon]